MRASVSSRSRMQVGALEDQIDLGGRSTLLQLLDALRGALHVGGGVMARVSGEHHVVRRERRAVEFDALAQLEAHLVREICVHLQASAGSVWYLAS